MSIQKMYSFLVPPGRNEEVTPNIRGTELPLEGKLFNMLKDIYDRSEVECDIDIYFLPEQEGVQNNECRNDIITLIRRKNLDHAKKIAERLFKATTHKSGLGLLFFIIGKTGDTHKIVVSRFPAEEGVTAEEDRTHALSVKFIERVFMKNAHSYKSVFYTGSSFDSDFWIGKAIDKQLAMSIRDLCNYWIRIFLISEFTTTPKAGTRRLAIALRNALHKTEDVEEKKNIQAAAVLAGNLNGNIISIDEFCSRYNLNDSIKEKIRSELPSPLVIGDRFMFDKEEYDKFIKFQSVGLANGATLIAEANKFDECFEQEVIDEQGQVVKYSTQGKIINADLKSRV